MEETIAELGLPTIHQYRHGLLLDIKPDGYHVGLGEIVFMLADQKVLALSTLGEVSLMEVRRPANLIGEFKKCFAVMQGEETLCYSISRRSCGV